MMLKYWVSTDLDFIQVLFIRCYFETRRNNVLVYYPDLFCQKYLQEL